MLKNIKGYEGHYKVSSEGYIVSVKKGKELILKNIVKKDTFYNRVGLTLNGVNKIKRVHRLVAEAFIPNPENKPCVCHKVERIPMDDSVSNLFWGTHKENMQDMKNKGRQNWDYFKFNTPPSKGKFGKDNASSKAVLQYSKDGVMIKEWSSLSDINREMNFSIGNISSCCNNKRRFANNFIWKYKN